MSRVRLIQGDALTTLETLASEGFDACLTDPPYGLSFMGRRWDHGVPSSEVWREVLRCLRPGASLMAFGGTRTYHRLAVAVEDAGFEIRDSVLVPGVVWSYGSGFPKSLDVSKAIDNAAGAEREKVQPGNIPAYQRSAGNHRPWMDNPEHKIDGPTPVTPEAARWEGYGTALKPAWEPVVWAMKPVDGTFARNAIEHGVAGLNVGAGRVGTSGGTRSEGEPNRLNNIYGDGMGGIKVVVSSEGRFPANLILAHLPGCRREWTKRVKSASGPADYTQTGAPGAVPITNNVKTGAHHGDPDGTEEVASWQCVEGCPVLVMDRASGKLSSGMMRGGTRRTAQDEAGSVCYGVYGRDATKGDTPADSGTASRFFQQCAWEPGEFERTLLYYAKAPTAERMVDGERLLHPTMKPLALTTYLARMLLPLPREDGQPRRLLVPYSGVGSEVIGALRAGWDEVVAIELDADGEGWIEKSARRIEADAPLFNEVEIVSTP